MSERKLSDWIAGYMQYSQYSEAPNAFHFWTGVSCIAGALRRRVWIDQGYFQWVPNFYIVFVAPPGIVSKSTTANIGMNLLRRVPGVHFGPDAVTWQSLVQSLAQATEAIELPNNKTIAQSAITISSGEFGTFLNPNDREMVDVLVSLWDGQVGVWEKATKTQGNDRIVNPWINIVACTTPAWIAGNFPEYMIGGGFTSRTVFVYAEEKRQLVAYPKRTMPEDLEKLEEDLIHDLEVIATSMVGEYELSPEALTWGTRWYEEHYENGKHRLNNERFAGYLARKQTHLHKLAMILAASKRNKLVITEEELIAANELVTALEADMPKVFANIAAPEARAINQVAQLVRQHGRLEYEECYGFMYSSMTYNDFKEAVKSAIQAKLLTSRQKGNQLFLYPYKEKKNDDT